MQKKTRVIFAALFAAYAFGAFQSQGGTNQVTNGSFEITSNPGLADGWGSGGWGLRTLEEINNPEEMRKRFSVDTADKVNGRNSIKIVNPAGKKPLALYSAWINFPKFMASRKGWCVSAYIKIRPASRLKMELLDSQYNLISAKYFDVGDLWQLCSFNVSTKMSPVVIRISPPAGTTCFIDSVQFNKGTTPEEWSPSAYDKMLAAPQITPRKFDSDAEVSDNRPDAVERVNAVKNWVYVNGKPFFPYAVMMQFQIDLQFLRQIKKSGFNTVNFYASTQDQTRRYLDLAREAGLLAVPWIHSKASETPEIIRALRNHPALVTWLVIDEPPEPFAQNVVDLVAAARKADSGRPLWVNYRTNEINRFMPKLSTLPGDIISADWYPVADRNYPAKPCDPAGLIEKMVTTLRGTDKITWFALQLCGYAFMFQREPTPEEFEGMVYSSVVAGTKGLFFFQNIPWNSRLMKVAGKIGAELNILTPILAEDSTAMVTTSNKQIIATARSDKEYIYVIAVNTSTKNINTVISVTSGNPGNEAKVIFEERSVKGSGAGQFQDRFDGFQRHIYRIKIQR